MHPKIGHNCIIMNVFSLTHGMRLISLGTPATSRPILPAPNDNVDKYRAVSRMRIRKGKRRTRRKPAPVPICPSQIPRDLTWDRNQAVALGSWRLAE
jgi:hypothetical protein